MYLSMSPFVSFFKHITHIFGCKDKSVVLKISETAGQEDYRCMVESFYRDAGIALILYDMSSHVGIL